MAITTMEQLATALSGAHQIPVYFPHLSGTAGFTVNLNRLHTTTSFGTAAAATTASDIQTGTLAGYPTLSGVTGKSLYIARSNLTCQNEGSIIVYDRIWARGGFSGIVVGEQYVGTMSSLPADRAPNAGENLEIWIEGQTTTGGTATSILVQYYNELGQFRQTPYISYPTSFGTGRLLRLPLQVGDKGVTSISNVQLSGTTGTAGNFAVTLLKRKCVIPIRNRYFTGSVMDFAALGLPEVSPDACLQFVHTRNDAGTGIISGFLDIVAG